MDKILILNGPNLNLLGTRKPEIYGNFSLDDVEKLCVICGKKLNVKIVCKQSNCEGTLVDEIQNARGKYLGIVLNAGAYAHYSYAIRDAIEAITVPVVDVHISDINAREEFRKNDVIKEVCKSAVVGEGIKGYLRAIEILVKAGR